MENLYPNEARITSLNPYNALRKIVEAKRMHSIVHNFGKLSDKMQEINGLSQVTHDRSYDGSQRVEIHRASHGNEEAQKTVILLTRDQDYGYVVGLSASTGSYEEIDGMGITVPARTYNTFSQTPNTLSLGEVARDLRFAVRVLTSPPSQ